MIMIFRRLTMILPYLTALLILVLAGVIADLSKKPLINISKQDSSITLNEDFTLLFSVGQRRVLADYLWITTLLESDHDHYEGNDLNSWMYKRFNSITTFDEKFYEAYLFGGKYLNIIKDDLAGADRIFTKSETHFKFDYDLNFNAGFLYAFELNNPKKAIIRYERILDAPHSPKFLKSLVSKLKFKNSNNINEAYLSLLQIYEKEDKSTAFAKKLESDLYGLKATIDLNCLNNNLSKCSKTDFSGNPYIYIQESHTYKAKQKYENYKIYK